MLPVITADHLQVGDRIRFPFKQARIITDIEPEMHGRLRVFTKHAARGTQPTVEFILNPTQKVPFQVARNGEVISRMWNRRTK